LPTPFSAGLELGRQVTGNQRFEGRFAGNAATLTVPIIASDSPRQVSWLQTASSTDNHGLARVSAFYVQDQADLTDHVKIVAGVRFERFITEVDDRRTVGFPAGQQRRFKVTDDLTSPRLGLIIKPAPSTSFYAAVSRTYQPRGGDQLTGLSLTNQNLEPEEFRNQEVGLKWDVQPAFSVTAAIFQLDRSNVLALSNPANPLSPTIPVGRQRTTGLEVGAAGAVTDTLNLVAAYTYSDGRFLDSVSGTVSAGNRPANLPDTVHPSGRGVRLPPIWRQPWAGPTRAKGSPARTTGLNFRPMTDWTRLFTTRFRRTSRSSSTSKT